MATYDGMLAESVRIQGHGGQEIDGYLARPLGAGPFPSVVLIHHMPGWDEASKEMARKLAFHGFATISPDLHYRERQTLRPGATSDEASAAVRDGGGMSDDVVVGDVEGAMRYLRSLPYTNGKVGVIGFCSGGRQTFLVACRSTEFDAAVECWGGGVVMPEDQLTEKTPVAPIDYSADLSCPLLGIFGNDDQSPSPEQVNLHEEELKKHGKNYEFHRYDNAGHGLFYYDRAMYRQEQAVDGWDKVFAFLDKHLGVAA